MNTRRCQKEEPAAHGDVVKHKRGAERRVFGELWNAGVLDATNPLMAVSQMHLEHALLRGQPVWRSALLVSDRHVPQMLDLHNVRPHEHGLMQFCHACRQRRTSGCSSHRVATRVRGQRRPATRKESVTVQSGCTAAAPSGAARRAVKCECFARSLHRVIHAHLSPPAQYHTRPPQPSNLQWPRAQVQPHSGRPLRPNTSNLWGAKV